MSNFTWLSLSHFEPQCVLSKLSQRPLDSMRHLEGLLQPTQVYCHMRHSSQMHQLETGVEYCWEVRYWSLMKSPRFAVQHHTNQYSECLQWLLRHTGLRTILAFMTCHVWDICGLLTSVSVAGKVWHTPAHSPLDDVAHLHLTSSPSASNTADRMDETTWSISISYYFTWNRYPSIAVALHSDNRRHVWYWRGVDKAIVRSWRQIHFNPYFPTTSSLIEVNPTAAGESILIALNKKR